MKKNTNKQLAQALFIATRDARGSDLEKVIENFVILLHKERKLKQADNIIVAFIKHAKRQIGIVEAEIITARETSDSVVNKVQTVLRQKIETTKNIDAGLLGGLIVKTEDIILDASLKTQLTKLKLTISANG